MTRSPRAAVLLAATALSVSLTPALVTSAQARPASVQHQQTPTRIARVASGSDPYDWPTYSRDNVRSGTAWNVAQITSTPKKVWGVALDGGVYGSPIVANGNTIVATQNNSVYRISGNKVVWRYSVGTAVPRSELPCGSIDPNGIISTPAYDAATGTVVVVGVVDNPIRHVAVGLDPATGAVKWTRSADVPANVPGIDPKAMQQRGALIVSGRRVYIAYGGLSGDCSTHRGAVVGIDLDSPSDNLWTFVVPTSRIGGIWAPGGPTERPGGGGLYVTVANGPTFQTGPYDYTNSVLRIAAQSIQDYYSPTTWRDDNQKDIGFGSQSPAIVGNFVFMAGKTGTAYVLHRDKLGNIGGEISQANICKSFGGTAVSGNVVYVPCTDGVRAVRIDSSGHMTVIWHAASTVVGSPVIGANRVWSVDTANGVLHALNPSTGQDVETMPVGAVRPWVKPTLWRNAVMVGTASGIVAYNW